MSSLAMYTLGRYAARGARYLGRQFVRSMGARAASRVAGSVGGIVQNALRRRRRARAWRTMKSYRRSAALGLGRTRYLSSVKAPFDYLRWAAEEHTSSVLRFCPIYMGSYGSGWQYAASIYKTDERFRAMCGLYKQFRILNVYYQITISGAIQSFGDIGIFARVIRNGNISTAFTDFVASNNYVCTPGVIWKRQTDQDRRLVLSLNVAPKTILEKSQWFTTDYNNNFCNVGFLNGVETDFCPMIDVCVYGRSAPTAASLVPIECWTRCSIEFRDAADGSDGAKSVVLDVDSRTAREISNALKIADGQVESVLDAPPEVVVEK